MAAISRKTRQLIKGYLEGFIQGIVDEYKSRQIKSPKSAIEYLSRKSPKAELKPFHAAIIPPAIIRINQFERGFSTRLGTSLEECARLIALEHHQDAQRGYDIQAPVSRAACLEIEHQKRYYENIVKGQSLPSLEQMIAAVLNGKITDDLEIRKVRSDLYILANDGREYFFEMKAPKPNKGQCLEVTDRILKVHLLRGTNRPKVQAYYAMAYNPYGPTRADYKWSYAVNYMPFEEAVIVGNEFWNLIGGANAYQELLNIYLEVGREKSKYMIDALALEF